jgi:hypothetical protein
MVDAIDPVGVGSFMGAAHALMELAPSKMRVTPQ